MGDGRGCSRPTERPLARWVLHAPRGGASGGGRAAGGGLPFVARLAGHGAKRDRRRAKRGRRSRQFDWETVRYSGAPACGGTSRPTEAGRICLAPVMLTPAGSQRPRDRDGLRRACASANGTLGARTSVRPPMIQPHRGRCPSRSAPPIDLASSCGMNSALPGAAADAPGTGSRAAGRHPHGRRQAAVATAADRWVAGLAIEVRNRRSLPRPRAGSFGPTGVGVTDAKQIRPVGPAGFGLPRGAAPRPEGRPRRYDCHTDLVVTAVGAGGQTQVESENRQ